MHVEIDCVTQLIANQQRKKTNYQPYIENGNVRRRRIIKNTEKKCATFSRTIELSYPNNNLDNKSMPVVPVIHSGCTLQFSTYLLELIHRRQQQQQQQQQKASHLSFVHRIFELF